MAALPLVVRVHDTRTNTKKTQAFHHSPVRVGRNKLNELVLENAFVSQWHAVIRFDDARTVFVDLGSTNGTMIGTKRVAKNTEIELTENVELILGELRVRAIRAAVPDEVANSLRTSSFQINAPQTYVGAAPNARTLMLDGQDGQTDVSNALSPSELTWFAEVSGRLTPFAEASAKANKALLQHVEYYLSHAPADSQTRVLIALVERFKDLTKTPGFLEMLGRLKIDPTVIGEVDITTWLNRLIYADKKGSVLAVDRARLLERVGAVLEAFGSSYVDLRGGYQQFTSEIAVRSAQASSGLSKANDARKVLGYLLAPETDATDRIDELTRSFADMAIHQVAVLSGVIEGTRSLLLAVSPQQAFGVGPQEQVPTPSGFGAIFQAPKLSGAWKKFVTAHVGMLENDRFTREVFGKSFARAYYAVTGNQVQDSAANANHTTALPALKSSSS